jgi:hypothetical protein
MLTLVPYMSSASMIVSPAFNPIRKNGEQATRISLDATHAGFRASSEERPRNCQRRQSVAVFFADLAAIGDDARISDTKRP